MTRALTKNFKNWVSYTKVHGKLDVGYKVFPKPILSGLFPKMTNLYKVGMEYLLKMLKEQVLFYCSNQYYFLQQPQLFTDFDNLPYPRRRSYKNYREGCPHSYSCKKVQITEQKLLDVVTKVNG